VIQAGEAPGKRTKNFYAAGIGRVFSFVRNIFIQTFIYKNHQKGTAFAYL